MTTVKYENVRVGDSLAVVGTVVTTNAAGLGLKIGDDVVVPIRHRVLCDHTPTIQIGDVVREKGSEALGGPRVGTVTQFLDGEGEPCTPRQVGDSTVTKVRAFIVVMPESNALGTREPKVYRPHQIERFPLSEVKSK